LIHHALLRRSRDKMKRRNKTFPASLVLWLLRPRAKTQAQAGLLLKYPTSMKNNSSTRETLTPNQRELLAAARRPVPETFVPKDYIYQFGEIFPQEPNTLFATKDKRLFLGNVVEGGKINDLHEVSLKEALEWYVRCAPFSNEGSGTVELLCEMAAKAFKEVA
jgi:hypothetical protein